MSKTANTRTVWITKHALTRGIYSLECECGEQYARYHDQPKPPVSFRLGRDAHLTRIEAFYKVHTMIGKVLSAMSNRKRTLLGMDAKYGKELHAELLAQNPEPVGKRK